MKKRDKIKDKNRFSDDFKINHPGIPGVDRVMSIVDLPASQNDPFGSYTGKPIDPADAPVQDADDL